MSNALAALVLLAFVAALAYLQRAATKAREDASDARARQRAAETARQQAERRAKAAERLTLEDKPYAGKLADDERAALVDSVRAKIRGASPAGGDVLRDATAGKPKSR